MNLKSLFGKARKQAEVVVEKRGGTEALKADAAELNDIARGKGTLKDKAKEAADALKDPGAKDRGTATGPTEPPATPDGAA